MLNPFSNIKILFLIPVLFFNLSTAAKIPLNIGVGPTLHFFQGPIGQDEPFYYGFSTDLYAVITKGLIQKNIKRVPKKFRRYAKSTDEIQYKGLIGWLPNQFVIHPKINNTGMYGGSISLIGLNVPLIKSNVFRFKLGVKGPTVTYIYMDSDVLKENKNFLGAGASGVAEAKLIFTPWLQLAARWDSHIYIPWEGVEFEEPNGDKTMNYHHGAFSILLNIRIVIDRKI